MPISMRALRNSIVFNLADLIIGFLDADHSGTDPE